MDQLMNNKQFDIPELHCRKLFDEPITNEKKTFLCDFAELEEDHSLVDILNGRRFENEGEYIQEVLKNNVDYILGMIKNYHNDFIMKNIGNEVIEIQKSTENYVNPKRSQTYRVLNMAIENKYLADKILIDINTKNDGSYEMGDINRSDFIIIFNGGCRIRICLDNDDDETLNDMFLGKNQFATLIFRAKKHNVKIFINDENFEKEKKDFHIFICDTFCFGKQELDEDVINKN